MNRKESNLENNTKWKNDYKKVYAWFMRHDVDDYCPYSEPGNGIGVQNMVILMRDYFHWLKNKETLAQYYFNSYHFVEQSTRCPD